MPRTWAQAAPENPKEACILLEGTMGPKKLEKLLCISVKGPSKIYLGPLTIHMVRPQASPQNVYQDCNAAQSTYNMASFLQTTKYNQACSLRMTYGISLERSRSNDVYLYTTCLVHIISFYKIPEYNDTQLLQVYATSQRQTPQWYINSYHKIYNFT